MTEPRDKDGGALRLVDAVRGYIDPALNDLHARLDALEERVRELQASPPEEREGIVRALPVKTEGRR